MSNMRVARASKQVDDINIGLKKYKLTKIFINLDDSKASFNKNELPTNYLQSTSSASIEITIQDTKSTYPIRNNNDRISKLCTPCIGSKFIQIVR